MAEPTETITQQLIHRATDPFSLAILVGVASSSFFFFGNLGLALDGILPATITESERARERISDASALKMWEWMYHRGKVRFPKTTLPSILTRANPTVYFPFVPQKHFGSTGLLGGISYLVASAFRPDLRPILYGASLFSFAPLLYTGVVCEYPDRTLLVDAELTDSLPNSETHQQRHLQCYRCCFHARRKGTRPRISR